MSYMLSCKLQFLYGERSGGLGGRLPRLCNNYCDTSADQKFWIAAGLASEIFSYTGRSRLLASKYVCDVGLGLSISN